MGMITYRGRHRRPWHAGRHRRRPPWRGPYVPTAVHAVVTRNHVSWVPDVPTVPAWLTTRGVIAERSRPIGHA